MVRMNVTTWPGWGFKATKCPEKIGRLGLVKESLRLLVEELRPTDRVGLVVYGSNAHIILEPTYVDSERMIMDAIDRLRPEGSTNAAEGDGSGASLTMSSPKFCGSKALSLRCQPVLS